MHEYSLVEALVRRVEEEARRRGALRIHRLSVKVGELSGVDPELFSTAYDTFRAGTLCAEVPHPDRARRDPPLPLVRRAGAARRGRRRPHPRRHRDGGTVDVHGLRLR